MEKRSIWKILKKFRKSNILEISKKYKTDHKVKKLPVQVFLLCILATEILKDNTSLRDFKSTFESPEFQKHILQADESQSISFVAFHYRLKSISCGFFEELYKMIRNQYNRIFRSERKKYLTLPVDSTTVVGSNKVLKVGYETTGKGGKKQIKFTIVFNGEIPLVSDCYTDKTHNSENIALKETMLAMESIEKMNEKAKIFFSYLIEVCKTEIHMMSWKTGTVTSLPVFNLSIV